MGIENQIGQKGADQFSDFSESSKNKLTEAVIVKAEADQTINSSQAEALRNIQLSGEWNEEFGGVR
jgi:hypothetical protein